MSYRLDLDEMSTETLVEELRRRGEQLSLGNCTYCGRSPEANTCKLEDVHNAGMAADAAKALHDAGDRKGWDASKRMNEPCAFINQHALSNAFQIWLLKRPR